MTIRYIRQPDGIPAPTRRQIREIKRILFLPADIRFPRCTGKIKAFVKKCEEKGDYSHSDKIHICDKCRCKKRAGQGTRGDFYGLGVETGHLGVGFCHIHNKRIPDHKVLSYADAQLRRMQQVGEIQMSKEIMRREMEQDAREAELSLKARSDLELVVDTLNKFKKDLEEDNLTERTKDGLGMMSDATKIKLSLDVAKTLSRVKLDHFKLDSSSYIHYDELKIRLPRMLNLVSNLFEKLFEMTVRGEENAVERVNEEWVTGLKSIWDDTQTGAKK